MLLLMQVAVAAPCYYLNSVGPTLLEHPAPCVIGAATPAMRSKLESVRSAFSQLFFPIQTSDLAFTDAGYISLPIVHFLTDEERRATQRAEHLISLIQREKATSALGPALNGEPIYSHFLGADERYTDLWARPQALIALLRLSAQWNARCLSNERPIPHASARSCTLQIGDLAYFTPLRPDPLGHLDHFRGNCVDLRLFRRDGSRYEAWWNRADDRPQHQAGYSRELTTTFVSVAASSPGRATLFFNDPAVLKEVSEAKARPKHDDHIHLCFSL